MKSNLLLAALLCFVTWMTRAYASHGPVANCCMQWSTTKIPAQLIVYYNNQTGGLCPIDAIIFHTKKGKRICSDPSDGWARKVIQKLDAQKKQTAVHEMLVNEDGSASDVTPKASVTPKKTWRRTTKGNRRLKKKLRRGKKGQKSG
ncbi:uncharacterized protein V6R79_006819 [Siganus canaliculatus]